MFTHHQFPNPYQSHHHQQNEILHPHTPYEGLIPGGLAPGKQIHVRGVVRHHADRLEFNINGRGGKLLHINPRFLDNVLVINSENYGSWGAEERSGLPLQRGQHFDLIISVEPDRYRVTVNGHHAFDFRHRSPVQEAERFQVTGEVDLQKISFTGGQSSGGHDVHNPQLPFVTPIVNGVQPGRMIQVHGHIPFHANRLAFNIQSGPSAQSPNINLHFSAVSTEKEIKRWFR